MNCKPICLLIMILTLLLLLTGAAAAVPENKITNLNDLKNIGNTDYNPLFTMSANYTLMENISIDDTTWNSIGNSSRLFKGYLNGNGKTITFTNNIQFNSESGSYGLFETVDNGAKLENISLIAEGNLTKGAGGDVFGILTGSCDAGPYSVYISNCSLTIKNGFSMIGDDYTGGLVGSTPECSTVSIENCSVVGSISGNVNVGGLVGKFGNGTVKNCIAVCDVKAKGSSAGCLFGTISSGNVSVQNCSAFGTVISDRYVAGGLIGAAKSSNGIVENCYASVKTECKINNGASGGLIGELWAGSVKNCYATGDAITNNGSSGGLIGYIVNEDNNDMTVTNCYATGTVTGNADKTGGLVGFKSPGSADWNATESFYLGTENTFGTQITSAEMKQIETFENWNISEKPMSTSVWYMIDGYSYPKLYCHLVPVRNADDMKRIGTDEVTFSKLGSKPSYWGLDSQYTLLNNINLNNEEWTPIGTEDKNFKGLIFGNNKTISNLNVDIDEDYVGLFGFAKDAIFSDIILINSNVSGGKKVGSFVGYSEYSLISNCYATGSVKGTDNIGGLVGQSNFSDISESCSICFVEGTNFVGGLGGYFNSSRISKCYSTDPVKGISNIGGLVGYLNNGDISESYSVSYVNGTNFVGGLVGVFKNSEISNSYSVNSVEGDKYVGGMVGSLYSSDISDSYSAGSVKGNDDTGGFVGLKSEGNVIDCFYIGVSGDDLDNECATPVSSIQMKSIDAFTVKKEDDGFIEGDGWSISSSYDPEKTWFILEGRDYPKLSWQYKAPSNGGSGTGQAVVINSTDEIPDLTDNTIHDSSEIPSLSEENDDVSKSGYDVEDNTGPDWKLYLIIGIGLIVVISGVAYFLNKRNGA